MSYVTDAAREYAKKIKSHVKDEFIYIGDILDKHDELAFNNDYDVVNPATDAVLYAKNEDELNNAIDDALSNGNTNFIVSLRDASNELYDAYRNNIISKDIYDKIEIAIHHAIQLTIEKLQNKNNALYIEAAKALYEFTKLQEQYLNKAYTLAEKYNNAMDKLKNKVHYYNPSGSLDFDSWIKGHDMEYTPRFDSLDEAIKYLKNETD